MVAETLPKVLASSAYSNSSASTSTARNDIFNQQSFLYLGGQNSKHMCDICSHEFRTSGELDLHQQQGCEGLIDLGSTVLDSDSECDIKTDENRKAMNNGSSIDTIDEQSTSSKSNANRQKRNHEPGLSRKRKKIDKSEISNRQALKKRHVCDVCDESYSAKRALLHHRLQHGEHERQFTCELCDKK